MSCYQISLLRYVLMTIHTNNIFFVILQFLWLIELKCHVLFIFWKINITFLQASYFRAKIQRISKVFKVYLTFDFFCLILIGNRNNGNSPCLSLEESDGSNLVSGAKQTSLITVFTPSLWDTRSTFTSWKQKQNETQ